MSLTSEKRGADASSMAADANTLTDPGQRLLRHYDEKYGTSGSTPVVPPPAGAPRTRHEACLHYLPRYASGGTILELGAGDGLLARSLAAQGLPFDRYVATEASSARLASLESSLGDPRFEARALDIDRELPEDIGTFDTVILLALVEHLIDPIDALRRVRSLLKPGGVAFIDTPNIAKYTRRVRLALGQFPSTASREEGLVTFGGDPVDLHDEGHLHYFTYRSLSRLLVERCGFRETIPTPYTTPPSLFGVRVDDWLARMRPQLFAELCLVARA